MNSIALFLLLSIFWAIIITSAANEITGEKCFYRETVDLTNQTRNFDGSYQYQDINIPPEKQSLYNYKLLVRNQNVTTPQHLRGCVCNTWKPCIKLCCEKDAVFNATSYKCEKLPKDSKITWDLTIRLTNYSDVKVNIFEQFIYQVGTPCNETVPLVTEQDIWMLLENGTLNMTQDEVLLDTVSYCFTPYKFNESSEYLLTPFSCPMKQKPAWTLILNAYRNMKLYMGLTVTMALSVLFLIPTIVVYSIVKELRENLRGKLLISYLLSLVIAYGIISFINISQIRFKPLPCRLLGYTCYFFFMAAYLWLSVFCYDIWKNLNKINFELNWRENIKRFVYYSLYTWIFAGILTGFTIWADFSESIADKYKPGIGIEICWLDSTKWSAAIYFYGPNLIILLFNFATFTYFTVHIYEIRQKSAKITHKEYASQENAAVILRLFLVMGVSWIFDILSYCFPGDENSQLLFILTDLVNATQGILIFALFVLKRNVLVLLKKRFHCKVVHLRSSSAPSPKVSTNL